MPNILKHKNMITIISGCCSTCLIIISFHFRKPNNLFVQQHHEAKALFCNSVPIDPPEGLGKITALDIFDDCNYFIIAGVRGENVLMHLLSKL